METKTEIESGAVVAVAILLPGDASVGKALNAMDGLLLIERCIGVVDRARPLVAKKMAILSVGFELSMGTSGGNVVWEFRRCSFTDAARRSIDAAADNADDE